jgi:fused-like protein
VAVKLISKAGKNEKDVLGLRQEIDILRTLRHPNIIEMLDAFETKTDFCVVTEFAQGELFQILEDDQSLAEDVVRSIARQLVDALHYLHSNRIIHRDMKPQNILIAADGTGKFFSFLHFIFFFYVAQITNNNNNIFILLNTFMYFIFNQSHFTGCLLLQ